MARFKGEKEMEDSPKHEAAPGDMAEDAAEGYSSVPRKKLLAKIASKRGKKAAPKGKGKRKRSKKVVKKNSKNKRGMRKRTLADELNSLTSRGPKGFNG